MRYKYWGAISASLILGLVFVVSGLGKLLSQAESFKTIFNPSPDFLAPVFAEAVFTWLPYIELIIGLLLIVGISAKLMAVFPLVPIAGFITNNSWLLSRGQGYEPYPCFGIVQRIIQIELSTAGALYLDVGLLALVSIILLFYPGNLFTIRLWFLGRGKIA